MKKIVAPSQESLNLLLTTPCVEEFTWTNRAFDPWTDGFFEHLIALQRHHKTLRAIDIKLPCMNTNEEAKPLCVLIRNSQDLVSVSLQVEDSSFVAFYNLVLLITRKPNIARLCLNSDTLSVTYVALLLQKKSWIELRLVSDEVYQLCGYIERTQTLRSFHLTINESYVDDVQKSLDANLSICDCSINGTISSIQQRNRQILEQTRKSVVQILLIGKMYWKHWMPYDIVRRIAQYVWSTRFDPDVWLFKK